MSILKTRDLKKEKLNSKRAVNYLNSVVTVESLFFLDSNDGRIVIILRTGRIPEEINAVGRFRS
jgi:hypothetical protein